MKKVFEINIKPFGIKHVREQNKYPVLVKEGWFSSIHFALMNDGEGHTFHLLKDFDGNVLIENAIMNKKFRPYIGNHPRNAVIPISRLIVLCPRAFYIPYNDLVVSN